MRTFSMPETARIAGLSEISVQRLAAARTIAPEIGWHGKRRLGPQGVFAVALATHLRERQDIGRLAAEKLMRFLSHVDLEKRIQAGERWVALAGDQVWLCSEYSTIQRTGPGEPQALIVVDLVKAWAIFEDFLRGLDEGQPLRRPFFSVN